MDYILGVDGGNSKTDYFLFDVEGNFIGMHRDGTCSHEALSDSFEGTRRVMRDALDYFLKRRKVRIEDIKAALDNLNNANGNIAAIELKNPDVISVLSAYNTKNKPVVPIKGKRTHCHKKDKIIGIVINKEYAQQ